MAGLIEELDHGNFKATIPHGDRLRHKAYFTCWKAMWEWQGARKSIGLKKRTRKKGLGSGCQPGLQESIPQKILSPLVSDSVIATAPAGPEAGTVSKIKEESSDS